MDAASYWLSILPRAPALERLPILHELPAGLLILDTLKIYSGYERTRYLKTVS
jgi:hypothetical protein